ncbi:ABC transporter ATP-binding protein [Propioniciclava soli]|uniref:ABC transporter ATP-binding protein n=1 Tax=Propioniciclava soli TaxID=2775081 RepID=A0ABZ3C733_9ACTN
MTNQIEAEAPTATRGAPAPLIAAHDVRKSYQVGRDSVEILHGVSLGVHEQEMVAVMGPSGSGKSTLLYCLAGLEAPTSGGIILAGKPLDALSRADLARMRRSQVGFVFQSYNLIPTLTATENVALPYLLDKAKPPQDLIASTLATVGLAERADARPPSMSGGEQQRVALARVLAQQPQVIFADEPTGALDTRTGELVLAELVRIAHTPGRCVLVVTHDPKVAASCDRILFMRDGLLVRELHDASVDTVAATLAGLGSREV